MASAGALSDIGFDDMLERFGPASLDRRQILAIAGAPGSGKSTLAEQLVAALNAHNPEHAALLPMDGYHYDDVLLAQMGKRETKGAPDTFDVDGLRHMLARLRENQDDQVAVPVFDRDIEISRAGSRLIAKSTNLIVVEGNYLLLDVAEWSALAVHFDATVMIDCSEATLRERLIQRWNGFGLSAAEIERKVEEIDLPNGRTVMKNSAKAMFHYQSY